MLPFLLKKVRPQTGVIVKERQPDGSTEEREAPEDDGNQGLMLAAQDLIKSVNANDAQGVASALKSAFTILDAEPHVEGEHLNDEDDKE